MDIRGYVVSSLCLDLFGVIILDYRSCRSYCCKRLHRLIFRVFIGYSENVQRSAESTDGVERCSHEILNRVFIVHENS